MLFFLNFAKNFASIRPWMATCFEEPNDFDDLVKKKQNFTLCIVLNFLIRKMHHYRWLTQNIWLKEHLGFLNILRLKKIWALRRLDLRNILFSWIIWLWKHLGFEDHLGFKIIQASRSFGLQGHSGSKFIWASGSFRLQGHLGFKIIRASRSLGTFQL